MEPIPEAEVLSSTDPTTSDKDGNNPMRLLENPTNLGHVPDGSSLREIAHKIVDWKRFAPYMHSHFTEPVEHEIQPDCQSDFECSLKMLREWRDNSEDRTFHDLMKIFRDAGDVELVEVCKSACASQLLRSMSIAYSTTDLHPYSLLARNIHLRKSTYLGPVQRRRGRPLPTFDSASCVCSYLAVLAVALFAIICFKVLYTYLGQLEPTVSYTLPSISGAFYGSEKEMRDVSELLSFTHSEAKIIQIYGPPASGKSFFAIRLSHRLSEGGILVRYRNIDLNPIFGDRTVRSSNLTPSNSSKIGELVFMPKKKQKKPNFVFFQFKNKATAAGELVEWATHLTRNAILLLDDCDIAVHHHRKELQQLLEMISESSKYVKILLISRRPVYLLNGLKKYYLDYFDQNTAVYILEKETGMDLDRIDAHRIVNLVDRSPLALLLVSALIQHKNIPDIIAELESIPVDTLRPHEFTRRYQLREVFDLSYKLLKREFRRCAIQLSWFSGPFSGGAANYILSSEIGYNQTTACIEELTDMSLLSRWNIIGSKPRYNFQRLFKAFLHEKGHSRLQFNMRFIWYYSSLLRGLTHMYENASRQDEARMKLGNESHNIMDVYKKFFLLNSIDPKLLVNLSESLVSELMWNVIPQLDVAKVLITILYVIDSDIHIVLKYGGKQADELLILYVNMLARLDKFLSSYAEWCDMECQCENIFYYVYSDDRLSIFKYIISNHVHSNTISIKAQFFYNYYSSYLRSCHIQHVAIGIIILVILLLTFIIVT